MDINEELPKLKSMLSMASSKIDRWMGDALKEVRENQLQGSDLDAHRELEDKASHLRVLHRELSTLTSAVDNQLHEKEHVSEELDHVKKSIERQQETLECQDKTVDEKLKELSKGVELFQDRLGLAFKKTAGKRLQVVFTNIDHKDPDCPFYFFLQVEDGKYIITDCEPAVADLDVLVEKLNSTNNLRSFVVAIRKRFKKHVEK